MGSNRKKGLESSELIEELTLQKEVVEALRKPEAYNEDPGQIEVKQTHISYIFVTRRFVYKVKKAVNLGFLDFTTLEKRRFFCEKELVLNRRLCEDIYLEVVPVNKADFIKIGGKGVTVEYALKMKRLPEERIMTKLLEENKVDRRLIDKMAENIAEFHSKAKTNKRISEFGSTSLIEKNWKENYEQTKEFVGKTISPESYRLIRERISDFVERNVTFFKKRRAENRIRDCHGDIHSGNIFITDKIYIFDAIEFNDRFRYSDVTADIAFLTMDLDFKDHNELSSFFVEKYVKYSGDREILELLPFYKCYRAYVRGKVISFKLNDTSVDDEEKTAAVKEAKAYFELATKYAKQL
jgi:aminoglycoside phosphotransferase family enzyme